MVKLWQDTQMVTVMRANILTVLEKEEEFIGTQTEKNTMVNG